MASGVLDVRGVGPVAAAIILAAYSHHGLVRSEAAFAALTGASPNPPSSATRPGASSTGTEIGNSTAHYTSSPGPEASQTPPPVPTSSVAPQKAGASGKSATASNASSPARFPPTPHTHGLTYHHRGVV
jgi:hypothetical protein